MPWATGSPLYHFFSSTHPRADSASVKSKSLGLYEPTIKFSPMPSVPALRSCTPPRFIRTSFLAYSRAAASSVFEQTRSGRLPPGASRRASTSLLALTFEVDRSLYLCCVSLKLPVHLLTVRSCCVEVLYNILTLRYECGTWYTIGDLEGYAVNDLLSAKSISAISTSCFNTINRSWEPFMDSQLVLFPETCFWIK